MMKCGVNSHVSNEGFCKLAREYTHQLKVAAYLNNEQEMSTVATLIETGQLNYEKSNCFIRAILRSGAVE